MSISDILNNKLRNNNKKKQDILLLLSKITYSLFLLYYGWFQMMFFNIPKMSTILGALTIFFLLLHALANRVNLLNSISIEILVWVFFTFYSLLTGLLVARNIGYLLNSIFVFTQYLIMIVGMTYISLQDKKINFFINNYIFFAIVCAITTLYYGTHYSMTRITMSDTMNPNLLGLIMVIGLFCVLYNLSIRKISIFFFHLIILSLFMYIIILSGARKHLLSVGFILICWFLFSRSDIFEGVSKNKIIKKILFFAIIIFGIFISTNIIINSGIYIRLQSIINSITGVRSEMYSVAFDLFKENPIFGIGFNNYRVLSGFQTYSHSTYAENLACTGLIGVVLYFFPYVTMFYKIIRIKRCNNYIMKKKAKIIVILYFVLLFLGTSIIHFYSLYSSIAFGFIIIFNKLYFNNNVFDKEEMVI